MFCGRPIIGIAGGIGSGKSFVAQLFKELGCFVIDSDQQVRQAYADPGVQATLRAWWGDEAVGADGEVNRKLIAGKVFQDAAQRRRLEQLLHPMVAAARDAAMRAASADPNIVAFVWDTPLLFETGLHRQCDAVVFVDAPLDVRVERVRASRGWNEAQLLERQNLQWPLDKKREMSDHHVTNAADVGVVREQVKEALSRILAHNSNKPMPLNPAQAGAAPDGAV